MRACSRRGLLAGLAVAGAGAGGSGSAPSAAEIARLPRRVAGIVLPDTRTARAATDLARAAMPPFLFNHCLRTFLFGALTAKRDGIAYDPEAFLVAASLHDLGLVAVWSTPGQPFEMDSADAAKALVLRQGRGEAEAEQVWRSIAFHTSQLGAHEAPAVGLVGSGAGTDVFGGGLAALSSAEVAEVLQAFPRLGFKQGFMRILSDYCVRKPLAQTGTWTDAFCRAHAPDVHWPSLEAGMARAPFPE